MKRVADRAREATDWTGGAEGRLRFRTGPMILTAMLVAPLLALQAGVGTALASPVATPPSEGQKAIVVGFLEREAGRRRLEFLDHDGLRKELVAHGIEADLLPDEPDLATLRRFQVIVYGGFHSDNRIRILDGAAVDRAAQSRHLLVEYVRQGGGLIVLPNTRRYPGQDIEGWYNLVLADCGLQVLHEGLWDPTTCFTVPETAAFRSPQFFMATDVRTHEITRGVERLALPRDHLARGPPGCAAVQYSPDWTVVIAGGPGARSHPVDAEGRLDAARVGTFTARPPIVAIRELGEGRIVSIPLHSAYLTLNLGHPGWPATVERTGDPARQQSSHGEQLLINALWWASRRPRTSTAAATVPRTTEASPMAWPESVAPPEPKLRSRPAPPRRGIIGAHTRHSDGKGTVQDYAAAARGAGLDFIVFTEDLETLTAAGWEKLGAECVAVNATGPVHVLRGYEYVDTNDCRWAVFGSQATYPLRDDFDVGTRRIARGGALEQRSNFCPRMLLTPGRLPGHPSNLWWYFQSPVALCENADQDETPLQWHLPEYLEAQERLQALSVASFTRIRSPESVQKASTRCTLNVDSSAGEAWKTALDTSLSSRASPTHVAEGGREGVEWAQVSITQVDGNVYRTRGTQRLRVLLHLTSPVGLAEIVVHDGTRIVRRFLCHGEKDVTRTFDLLRDTQHYLVPEAIDVRGRRSTHSATWLYSYPQGFYRCSDNLNFLGSTPTVAHPDRHQYPGFPELEDREALTLRGFDTGVGLLSQPQATQGALRVQTSAGSDGDQPADRARKTPALKMQVPLDVVFASSEMNVVRAMSSRYVEQPFEDVVNGSFLPQGPDLQFATVTRESYLMRSRMSYYLKWTHGRPAEAAKDYRGGVFLHRGELTFRRDAVLSGTLPVQLDRVALRGDPATGEADELGLVDAENGPLAWRIRSGSRLDIAGRLRKGGYLVGRQTAGGSDVFVPISENMRYRAWTTATSGNELRWNYQIGLGTEGDPVRCGQKLEYAYLAVRLPRRETEDLSTLANLGPSFGVGETPPGKRPTVVVGSLLGMEGLLRAQAVDRQCVIAFRPDDCIIDKPVQVDGILPNGSAAVFAIEGPAYEQRFRAVGVHAGSALFQQRTDHLVTIWVGNVFYSDPDGLLFTPVTEGLGPGERPFLEVHNPAAVSMRARIRSPSRAPRFGGFEREVTVDGGSSIVVGLD